MTQTFRPDLVNVNTTLPCEPLFPRTRPNEEEWYFTFGERARILWICGGKQFFLFFELTEYFHRMDDERLHTPLYGVISRRALFDGVVLDSSLLEALVYGSTYTEDSDDDDVDTEENANAYVNDADAVDNAENVDATDAVTNDKNVDAADAVDNDETADAADTVDKAETADADDAVDNAGEADAGVDEDAGEGRG